LIQAACKLPSGAFALTFKSIEVKRVWYTGGLLVATFGPTAKVKEIILDVIAFGFQNGLISRMNGEERVREMIYENLSFVGSLRRVGVLKGSEFKQTETIVLGFSEPIGANRVIDQGVAWEANIMRAELYTSSVRTRRCFKCQSYIVYIAKYCRSQGRCGWCAQTVHIVDQCLYSKDIGAKVCAPCGGIGGHCALDPDCPLRRREEQRARAVYATRPARFNPGGSPNRAPSRSTTPRPRAASPATPTPAPVAATPMPIFSGLSQSQERDEEGYTRLGNKRRRGRPCTVSTADISGIPNIASFLNVPDTQFTSTPLISEQVPEPEPVIRGETIDKAITDIVPDNA
jgi:hypothetical protein